MLGAVTWHGQWGYLWREWFTTVDHKKIGIMYIILAIVMLLRGFADAIMMVTQKALAVGASEGYLPPHHYDQIFTAHGTIMIFFMAMPFVTGVMNYIMPLQIGARDVAFPFLNNFSFWMTVGGAVLTMLSLFLGEFSRAGWLAYPPLAGAAYSPGVGVDYYIWGLQVAGVGTTLSGINLIATIVKMRAPGMTMMKMPVFSWTTLASNAIIVTIFPVLTATLAMLALDRYVGTHFFTNDFGGNSMMYMNLIWIWGIRRSTSWSCPRSASTRRWCLRSRASGCSATPQWSTPRPSSRSYPGSPGCTTSSRWDRAPTSTPSSASRP